MIIFNDQHYIRMIFYDYINSFLFNFYSILKVDYILYIMPEIKLLKYWSG